MTDAIKALVAAQAEMTAAHAGKVNPAFKSKYAELSDVMDACIPALRKHGFAVIQPIGRDEHGDYVETVFAHVSGTEFRSRVYLIIGRNDMQGYGSAVTYARRYGLGALAGITDTDDDGNAAAKAPPRRAEVETLSEQAKATGPLVPPGVGDAEKFIIRLSEDIKRIKATKTMAEWQKVDDYIRKNHGPVYDHADYTVASIAAKNAIEANEPTPLDYMRTG